jgi:hypothetical protein
VLGLRKSGRRRKRARACEKLWPIKIVRSCCDLAGRGWQIINQRIFVQFRTTLQRGILPRTTPAQVIGLYAAEDVQGERYYPSALNLVTAIGPFLQLAPTAAPSSDTGS